MSHSYGMGDAFLDRVARLDNYNIVQLQANIFIEQLVRDHPYDVNEKQINLVYHGERSELRAKLDSALLLDTTTKKITSINETYYFKAPFWIACCETPKWEYDEDILEDCPAEEAEANESTNQITVTVTYINSSDVDEILKSLDMAGFTLATKNDELKVSFAFPAPRGIRTENRFIPRLPMASIRDNYTPQVFGEVSTILSRILDGATGLVLFSGAVGTGKTYAIRAMLSEMTSHQPFVCSPAHQFLTQAGLLADVLLSHKHPVIVMEDLGDLLTPEAATENPDARANLLNISEGLMSMLGEVAMLFTFNHDMAKVDPAITRPGRCLGTVEFVELPYEQVQQRLDFEIPRRSYTLAELYEMIRIGRPLTGQTKEALGFRR